MLKNRSTKTPVVAAFVVALGLSACGSTPLDTSIVDARPKMTPTRTSTSLTSALSCLDRQLNARPIRAVTVAVGSMPDTSGKIAVSMRDMTIDAIMKATSTSGAFEVLDQVASTDISLLGLAGGLPQPSLSEGNRLPISAFNITGSISQVSEGDYERGFEIGVDTKVGGPGLRFVSQLSSLGTHMRMTRAGSGKVRFSSKLEVTVQKSSRGVDMFAGLPEKGLYMGWSVDRDDSISKAVETLIQLHVLELLGQAANVPYWECLALRTATPQSAMDTGRDWRKMNASDRKKEAERLLRAQGYKGAFDAALQRFQLNANETPTGRLDFATYLALQTASGSIATDKLLTIRSAGLSPGFSRLQIGLAKASYVACYYRAEDGVIAKILPNEFQPQKLLVSGRTHIVPDLVAEKQFRILAPQKGRKQRYLCVATPEPVRNLLGTWARAMDFRDLREDGVASLGWIKTQYQRLGESYFSEISIPE